MWDLFFFLPNIDVPVPTPFDGGIIQLCAGRDPILGQLHPSRANDTAAQMLRRFRTQFGERYMPACLIVQHRAPSPSREAQTLRSFRNLCAIATILRAYQGGQWQPTFSDHFDIYPLAPARSGWVVTNDAIVRGLQQRRGFSGQPSPLIQTPSSFTCQPTQRLFARLRYAWRLCYLRKRRRGELLRLFRSIEIALHASGFPTDSLLSVHDAGLRLVLWVSAFEILLHPGGGRIRLAAVLAFLRNLKWNDRRLAHKRYPVRYTGVPPRISLPEVIYYDLYMARNDFTHGNEVPVNRLWFRSNKGLAQLRELAPLLYWKALEQRLNSLFPAQNVQPPPHAPVQWLLTSQGRRYLQQQAGEWADMRGVEQALLRGARP